MKLDGKAIAEEIYAALIERIGVLRKQHITPTLAVILIGDDPGSISYVSQKEKFAQKIGVTLKLTKLPNTVTEEQLQELASIYNADPSIHGVIIQRPTPEQIRRDSLDTFVIPEKDVDGFHPNSDFAPPVALAVERLLYEAFKSISEERQKTEVTFDSFTEWLLTRDIVVMGKGQTAGTPIISHFHNRNAQITVIDSQTDKPEEVLNEADIIITAVGREHVLPAGLSLRNKIVIGVGLHTEEGKLRGDYMEADVEQTTQYYTTTPGGVGPVNVAMLLSNIVRATEEQTGSL